MKPTISAVIIAKNEEAMLANCLETVRWCDDIIVIDSGSTDQTADLAESLGARVISFSHSSFARVRDEGLKRVKTEWLFYLDADERVTPTLAKEIMVHAETAQATAMQMSRQNIFYGKAFHHGGWETDWVTRVFKKDALEGWFGDIHESPKFEGEATKLQTPLIHLTHRNTVDGLRKTIAWTPIEAQLLHKAGVPPVTFFTLLRKGSMEFVRRALFKRGSRDGMEGLIEALVQAINRVLVYIQVWELQRKPSLPDTYQQIELEIAQAWQRES